MARCMYCATEIAEDERTWDHVYPRALGIERSFSWHSKNKVRCCRSCNSYKGHLHPLDWLVIMPNNERAKVLAEHLVRLGEDMTAVFDAMRRRKR